jgi:hypothetical protein
MSQHDDTILHTRMFLENMVGLALNAKAAGLDLPTGAVVDSTLDKIVELAEQHFPLAKVLDNSDLVLHAEGPGASQNMPWLSALNWVTSTAEHNIKKLAAAYFDMHGANGKELARHVDPRLTGIAPGSLWIGIRLVEAENQLLGLEQEGPSLSDELHQLPGLIRFIDDEGMRPGIEEVSPDPAMRDISLAALLRFAPTGRKGIHTLEIATKTEGLASLGQRERVVLREAMDKPSMRASQAGSFVGEIREADLDKTRLHLRGVAGIGTLRCVVAELSAEQARNLLGRRVRAVGSFQIDKDGKPRLLFVERFEEVPDSPANLVLDLG